MATRTKQCGECQAWNGAHAAWCVSRGYENVGPHPDAPAPTLPNPLSEMLRKHDRDSMCPCGRQRKGCDYHDPALQPAQAMPDTERLTYDLRGAPIVGRYDAVRLYTTVLSWSSIQDRLGGVTLPQLDCVDLGDGIGPAEDK